MPRIAVLALAARALANVWGSRLLPPFGEDLNGIHLPTVASWVQTHSIWGNHEFEPFFAAGNYTQNVDISYLSTMLPLHQDVFARISVLPWYAFSRLDGLRVRARTARSARDRRADGDDAPGGPRGRLDRDRVLAPRMPRRSPAWRPVPFSSGVTCAPVRGPTWPSPASRSA